jgi:transposase InsO family protein
VNELLQDMLEFPDWGVHNFLSVHFSQDDQGQCDHLVQTRSESQNGLSSMPQRRIQKPKLRSIMIDPIVNWIGSQTVDQEIPKTIMDKMISDYPNYPSGLLVLPTTDQGAPRVLVPKYVQHNLVMQAHLDIHHQHYRKVHKLLRPIYYWPSMDSDIESICKSCQVCQTAKVRRQKLQADFDAQAPQAFAKPRQHYGIDFYGVFGGEILVIVDLFTRETILEWLPSRKQRLVVNTIIQRVVFERGVPFSIRSDNAPEFMRGIVKQLCKYLNISQILTGGHNPRGNAICERANQTLGAILRKLSDYEYKNIKYFIPAFQFAMNITPHSAIGCSPFEAGHGVPAKTLSSARLMAQQYQPNLLEGQDGDQYAIEDGNSAELQGQIKDLIELSMRMTEVVKSTSEWHRRMTSNNLAQNGRKINLDEYKIGTKVYFYKPPSASEAERRGRKAKHMEHYAGPAKII